MNLNNMKVSTKLSCGFGIAVGLAIVIAVIATVQMRELAGQLEDVSNNRMVKVGQFTKLKDNLNTIARSVRNIVIMENPALREQEQNRIIDLRDQNSKILAELDKTLTLPKAREQYKSIVEVRGPYNQAIDRVIALAKEGKIREAGVLLVGEVREKQSITFKAVDDSNKLQNDLAKAVAKEAAEAASRNSTILTLLAAAVAAIGGVIGWLITRSLSRALGAEPGQVSEAVQRVADSDLSMVVTLRDGDTTSTMAAVKRMQESLAAVVNAVRGNSESVATASAQIAQGNQDLSQRTEEQASALEETAASMEQLSSTVKQNADNARQANQLALGASTTATRGGEVVAQVVETMKGINDSSKKIADIIGVIDGIAFQTNILALNAAVEAARAGEQGRGFAVVASEVRSLAGRSAQAAKEIKSLIAASVERVEQGTTLVDQAGETMTEVVSSIKRVTDIMGEISAASTEQSQGVAQVGEAVSQMDQVTQQNAALVEESAAAAESLSTQAQQLVQAVAVFKLSHGSRTSVPAPVLNASTVDFHLEVIH